MTFICLYDELIHTGCEASTTNNYPGIVTKEALHAWHEVSNYYAYMNSFVKYGWLNLALSSGGQISEATIQASIKG